MELTEGVIVLCTVKKIEKTSIFLEIEGNGEGSMVLSEVAAGRIRNLREYVSLNKKIVCKILKIENSHVQLSLRRVTAKEKENVLERYKREKNIVNMLKTVTGNSDTAVNRIKEEYGLVEFFESAREDTSLLSKFFSKEESEKLEKVLKEREDKEKEVKKMFKLSSNSPQGILDIIEILNIVGADIRYLGSSRFSISVKAKNFKDANKKLAALLEAIKQKAKEKKALFEVVEK